MAGKHGSVMPCIIHTLLYSRPGSWHIGDWLHELELLQEMQTIPIICLPLLLTEVPIEILMSTLEESSRFIVGMMRRHYYPMHTPLHAGSSPPEHLPTLGITLPGDVPGRSVPRDWIFGLPAGTSTIRAPSGHSYHP